MSFQSGSMDSLKKKSSACSTTSSTSNTLPVAIYELGHVLVVGGSAIALGTAAGFLGGLAFLSRGVRGWYREHFNKQAP
jgi:hypothetical protein